MTDIIRAIRELRAEFALSTLVYDLSPEDLAWAKEVLGAERYEKALEKRGELIDRLFFGDSHEAFGAPFWVVPQPDQVVGP